MNFVTFYRFSKVRVFEIVYIHTGLGTCFLQEYAFGYRYLYDVGHCALLAC